MNGSKFKYDTRLHETELNLFEDLVGKSILWFRMEQGYFDYIPKIKKWVKEQS